MTSMMKANILGTLTPEFFIEQIRKLNTPLVLSSILVLLVLGVVSTGYHSVQVIFFSKKSTVVRTTYHPTRKIDVQKLATYHLLGATPVPTLKHIPLSKLGYTVNAILLDNNNVGQALIAIKGKSKLVKVDTTLAPGITVHAITATTVILSDHGRLGKLEMIAPIDFSSQQRPQTLFGNNNVNVIR